MALAPNTPPFVSGSILTAAQMTALPMGIVGYTRYTGGNQTVTSASSVDITGMTATINAVSTRLYKISFMISARKNSNAGYLFVSAMSGATTINEFGQTNVAGGYFTFAGSVLISGISGSTVIKMQTYVENASGTLFFSAGSPGFLTVEDVGLAP
jgi:hypothetical protein